MRRIAVALAVGLALIVMPAPAGRTSASVHVAAAACPRTAGVAASHAPSLVGADNGFGFRLFARLAVASAGKNVFISPASAAVALDMIYAGARGRSRNEMAAALGVKGLTAAAVRNRASALLAALQSTDPKVRLEMANAVWARAGVRFRTRFLDDARRFYGAKVGSLDFESPSAVSTINAWSRCATHGAVPSIVDRIASDVVMYVMNATYFRGQWKTAFDPELTIPGSFTTASGKQVQVPFMHMRNVRFPYFRGSDFQVMSVQYGGGRYSMVLALPDRGVSLSSLEEQLTLSSWRGWLGSLKPAAIPLAIPRFSLKNSWNLNAALRSLGMTTALGTHGNFSGICTRCVLTDVRQRTSLSVDEKGTTAAAVTTGTVSVTAVPLSMTLDHPFLLAVRDGRTGGILFLGAVNDPTK